MKTEAQKKADKAEANRRYREKRKALAGTNGEAIATVPAMTIPAECIKDGVLVRAEDAGTPETPAAAEFATGKPLNPVPAKAEQFAQAAVILGIPEKPAVILPAVKKARAKAAPAPNEPADKPLGKRAAILASAQAGNLPTKPDFSAETHKYYRKHLDAVEALINAGDVAGLKAYPIDPKCSSRMAVHRYRELGVIALEARAAA